jgi:hypothetical protein
MIIAPVAYLGANTFFVLAITGTYPSLWTNILCVVILESLIAGITTWLDYK